MGNIWFDPFNLFGGGEEDEPPPPPKYELPDWAQGLPEEQLALIRKYIGSSLQQPAAYGQAGDVYNRLLNYQPSQFQFPMAEIQKALEAQQGLQFEQYQKQIRPVLANQGQLDSTYYANLLDNYLKGQQAQTYGTTADLLTQQGLTNLDILKWLPSFQAGVAGQLQGLGSAQTGINQFNLGIPLTGQSALSGVYGQGLQLGDRNKAAADQAWTQILKQYEADQAQQAALISSLGQILGAGAGTLFALPTGGLSVGAGAMLGSSLGGSASTLFGGSGGGTDLGSALNYAYPQDQWAELDKILEKYNTQGGGMDLSSIFNQNTQFNPNWNSTPSYMNYGMNF